MQFATRVIDDFKTERKDVTPPLPPALRVVPIVFYLAVVLAIVLNAVFAFQITSVTNQRETLKSEARRLQGEITQVRDQRRKLEGEAKRASDIANWIESTRPLQPLSVNIVRSMLPESSLVDLRLDRDGDTPTQIKLVLRMNSEVARQLELSQEAISGLNFRTYSPQQTVARGEIDYQATLIWQEGAARPLEP